MSLLAPKPFDESTTTLRKAAIYSILDEICSALELTETQLTAAKASYEAVAEWLSGSSNPLLRNLRLYAHGSAGLGTTVKPTGRDDFDVDLICLVLGITADMPPAELKRLIGERLKEHSRYAAMLEEKKRCWRLNYAREFHLDVSPTIVNADCMNGGELVPDKKLREWKPTNPSGYKNLFEARANLQPRLRQQRPHIAKDSAQVEPFPITVTGRGVLRRTVQLLKRHRDIYFEYVEEELAPISIVITTLAAQAYAYCVRNFTFDTELDVLVDTIRLMPHFIERRAEQGRSEYWVPNETTKGENFADRWNSDPVRAKAFYTWHAKALLDFENFASLEGVDRIATQLGESLGDSIVRRVMDNRTEVIGAARRAEKLFIAPIVGLSLSNGAHNSPIPRNTYYGD